MSDNNLDRIEVTVIIPNYVPILYMPSHGTELSDARMREQASKVRYSISRIEADFSFDIEINEVPVEQAETRDQQQSELAAANNRVSELEDKVAFLSDLNQRRNNVEIEAMQAENARLQAFMESVEYALENSGNHKVAAIEALLDGYKLNALTPPEPEARYVAKGGYVYDRHLNMYEAEDGSWTPTMMYAFALSGRYGEERAQARADELNASDVIEKPVERYQLKWYGVSGWIIIDTETNTRLLVKGESWIWLNDNATIFSDVSDAKKYLNHLRGVTK